MKRAIGAAALGGNLLALGTARLGRPTAAEVRVCADGRVLSRLLGSCSGQSATSATVRAGDGIRARVRVPRTASADASLGTRRSRPAAGASGQASAVTRLGAATAGAGADTSTSPRARADAAASLSRPRAGRLLDLRPLASLAGVGLLGSSPFTLVGDPASDSLLPIGELTLDDPAAEAPAGIGGLDSGPITSGNQVDASIGDVSPSVPVTVCGNGVGLLGDATVSCGADTSTGGIIAPPPGTTPGSTDTDGTTGGPGSTGTSGIPGTTTGLTPGTSGGPGDPATTFAPLRPSVSGVLPFTGLLVAGVLIVRAARPATAATEGGEDR
jgi:hypothetical protein